MPTTYASLVGNNNIVVVVALPKFGVFSYPSPRLGSIRTPLAPALSGPGGQWGSGDPDSDTLEHDLNGLRKYAAVATHTHTHKCRRIF